MPDTFALTILFIVIVTIIAAFVKGRSKDKCLRDFAKNLVTLENTTGKTIWGNLNLESTGLELNYQTAHKDKSGHNETSYIMYKNEYPNIMSLIRYHDELNEQSKKERGKELERTYHPRFLRRLKRKMRSFFNTVKDSMMEVINLLMGQVKRTTAGGAIMSSQDKYISQIKQELAGSMGTSFEPLLERHIGKIVILELVKGDKRFEYPGILKDYTAEFIEIMDVNYKIKENEPPKKADLIVARRYGLIRHLGE